MSEPMITIKKPDGTFAKVTLGEFKKIQAAKKQSPAPVTVNQSANQVMGKSTVEIKNSHSQAKDTVQLKKMTREDARSPLEEKMSASAPAPLTSHSRDKQVETVLRGIGFGVNPDLQGRLKSLVLARLKDIKSEDEIKETLVRPVKNGGLGLVQSQVDKVLKSCRDVARAEISNAKENPVDAPVLKGKPSTLSLMVEPPELPMVIPVRNNSVIKTSTPPIVKKFAPDDVVSKIITDSMASEPIFTLGSKSAIRPTMQDVSAPDMEMGPVEEFRSITLTEFRRLSSSPEEAAKRLQQKISNLQEESYTWYLDAISAFHNSPLYIEYTSSVCQSLADRKTLANVLAAKNSIKLTEIMAIIEMENNL